MIDDWNKLPNNVKEAASAGNFKRQYRRHLEGTVAPAWDGQSDMSTGECPRARTSSSGTYGPPTIITEEEEVSEYQPVVNPGGVR